MFVWLCLAASLVFYSVAEYLSKKWALNPRPWLAVTTALVYVGNAIFWLPALRHHGSLAVLSCIYSLCYVVASVAIGYIGFQEAITDRQWLGIGLACVAILLLS